VLWFIGLNYQWRRKYNFGYKAKIGINQNHSLTSISVLESKYEIMNYAKAKLIDIDNNSITQFENISKLID
jgi:hypothetical protein